jgi:succinate dehydrogenase / fumarate reductase membrane anchor subunit
MTDYRTPLRRARGLGSAQHGVGHFIGQRVSALALVFLCLWGVWSALALAKGGYEGAREWLASPVNAALLVLLTLVGFYHVQLGARTIIEDYIARPAAKTALLIANAFLCWGGATLTAICLLKVASGGGVP